MEVSEGKSWVSLITNDAYLPGILVLNKTLHDVNTVYPLLVLLSPAISEAAKQTLAKNNIQYEIISEEIFNPTDVGRDHRWYPTYTKLIAFNQTQFKKIVFLDADMLILRNIDDLFDKPHMSAVSSGSMLPRKKEQNNLNSGLMVIEPNNNLFSTMINKIGKIEPLEAGGTMERPKYGSDQDFLQAYYSDWPNRSELHLDHTYNMIHYQIDEYNILFNFSIDGNNQNAIKVLHFASYEKPWGLDNETKLRLIRNPNQNLELQALKLWLDVYEQIQFK